MGRLGNLGVHTLEELQTFSVPLWVKLACGATLTLEMKRYANVPTVKHPWQR